MCVCMSVCVCIVVCGYVSMNMAAIVVILLVGLFKFSVLHPDGVANLGTTLSNTSHLYISQTNLSADWRGKITLTN